VAEVIRPNRQARRRRGKSDAADAVAAALAALSGEASGMPKSREGAAESIRMLKVARAGAVKARTQAGNQLRDLILTAPEQVRQQLAGLSCPRQVELAARFRPGNLACPAEGAKAAMAAWPTATKASPWRSPSWTPRSPRSSPARPRQGSGQAGRGHPGRGHAAGHHRRHSRPGPPRGQLRRAVRCQPGGRLFRHAAPPPARPRRRPAGQLRAGDDRHDPTGLRPADQGLRRPAHREGKTRKEIIRCLKRYIAREVYKTLCRPTPPGRTSTPQLKQDLSAPALT
jgi:hypothetical protein